MDKSYEENYKSIYANLRHYIITNTIDEWLKRILKINKDSLERLNATYELLKSLKEVEHNTILMLLAFCNMQQSIIKGLFHDGKLLRFVFPRKLGFKYEDYRIAYKMGYPEDFTEISEINDSEILQLANLLKEKSQDPKWKDILNSYGGLKYFFLREMVSDIARIIIEEYNKILSKYDKIQLQAKSNSKNFAMNAFITNLFVCHRYSFYELSQIKEENPPSKYPSMFQELRDNEIKSFKESALGNHWCDCIKDDEVESFSRFLINHRNTISEEEELRFFRQFDKICMIEDILGGKAEKYDIEVDYSKIYNKSCSADAKKKGQKTADGKLSKERESRLDEIIGLLKQAQWKAPATEENIELWLNTVFGRDKSRLDDEDVDSCKKMWAYVEKGKTDRTLIVTANIAGYLRELNLISGGPMGISEDIFGNKSQVNNINKGGTKERSQAFDKNIRFMTKYIDKIIRSK